MIVRNNHFDAAFFFVDHNAAHRCWLKRVYDESCGIFRPWNDVDLFALHFLHDGLNAATFHTNACADWVDAAVVADHPDLSAAAWVACGGLDFDDPVINFGNFLREQFLHEIRMCAAQKDLRAAIFALHLHDERTDAITTAHNFARDLLVAADNTFCPAKIDDNMAKLDRFHHACDNFACTILELFKLALALCIAHLLKDDLLCRLGVDATKVNCGQRVDNEVADNGALLQLVGLLQVNLLEIIFDLFNDFNNAPQAQVARLGVQLRTDVIFGTITGTRGALNSFFERFYNNRLVDHLFGGDRIGNCKQFGLVGGNTTGHVLNLPVLRREWVRLLLRPPHRF